MAIILYPDQTESVQADWKSQSTWDQHQPRHRQTALGNTAPTCHCSHSSEKCFKISSSVCYLFIFLTIVFSVYNAAIHISHPSTWSCLNSISSEFPSTVSWTISSNILLAAGGTRGEGGLSTFCHCSLHSSLTFAVLNNSTLTSSCCAAAVMELTFVRS